MGAEPAAAADRTRPSLDVQAMQAPVVSALRMRGYVFGHFL